MREKDSGIVNSDSGSWTPILEKKKKCSWSCQN